jgi:cytochrome c biogenesis protein
MASLRELGRKTWATLAAVRTGVLLLIVVVIVAAAGTLILQRPVTEADELQRAYSPQTLRILDALGLTDVFHAWWFVLLMVLVSLSIVAASIERFPNAWRFFARPYKYPEEGFRRSLAVQKSISIPDEETGLVAAERALHEVGFHPERIVRSDHFSLFAERNRISEMAVYVVHASLLLIFFGGIVDALWGWRGEVNLTRGQQSAQVQLRDGRQRVLPFEVRCESAGQENYQDGSPKKWWSKLTVVEAGREVQKKEIVVNDPLVYRGVRFYQASYGPNGKVDKLILNALPTSATPDAGQKKEIAIGPNEPFAIDADTTVTLAEFIPDYVVRDGQVYTRSAQIEHPAAHLVVESKKAGTSINYWLPALEGFAENDRSPYQFEPVDLKMGYFTGLEVSHEPGQWAVWTGVVLMGIGLTLVFYVSHVRVWVVPVRNAKGRLELWFGGTANRNRDAFEEMFRELTTKIEARLTAASEEHSAAELPALVAK